MKRTNIKPPVQKNTKLTLADLPWKAEDGKFVARSVIKIVPSIIALDAGKKYTVNLEDGRSYTGTFRTYRYTKDGMDSPLVQVALELAVPGYGTFVLPEKDVTGTMRA